MNMKPSLLRTLDGRQLTGWIRKRLNRNGIPPGWTRASGDGNSRSSAVLVLIKVHRAGPHRRPEPCLLLNKRSAEVLQPGDLCCPGGGVDRLDRLLAHLVHWPLFPLGKWPFWRKWRRTHPHAAARLATYLFTGLREGWEEMRLNPLKVEILGCLPVQKLVLFERHIYPLVGWMADPQRLVPNWEVERIVHIPLRRLMDPGNYGRYQLRFQTTRGVSQPKESFPCFVHRGRNGREVLWGATFRIAMDFLEVVFGFGLPNLDQSPVIHRQLGHTYLNGSRFRPEIEARYGRGDNN